MSQTDLEVESRKSTANDTSITGTATRLKRQKLSQKASIAVRKDQSKYNEKKAIDKPKTGGRVPPGEGEPR
jgi:hypothetical protein